MNHTEQIRKLRETITNLESRISQIEITLFKNPKSQNKISCIKYICIKEANLNITIANFGYMKDNSPHVADIRKICWYILYKYLNMTDLKISKHFKHHRSSITQGRTKLMELIRCDKRLNNLLTNIDSKAVKYLNENID